MLQIVIFLIIVISFFVVVRQMMKKDLLDDIGMIISNIPIWFKVVSGVGFLLIIFISMTSGRLIDFWWFSSLGDEFKQVFYTKYVVNTIAFFVLLLIFSTLIPLAKILFESLTRYKFVKTNETENKNLDYEAYLKFKSSYYVLPSMIVIIFTFISFMIFDWKDLSFFLNNVKFGVMDPIHNLDIGFYVFKLPFLETLLSFSFLYIFGLSLILVRLRTKAILYAYFDYVGGKKLYLEFFILAILAFQFMLFLFLEQYSLMVNASSDAVLSGPGYLTANWFILHLPLMGIFTFLMVSVMFANYYMGGKRNFQYGIVSFTMGIFVIYFIVALIYQNKYIDPDAYTYEKPYIEENMEMTRWGYALDFEKKHVSIKGATLDDINNNQDIVKNIRVHDFNTSIIPMDQFQRIRPFYDMLDVDVDKYIINGQDRLVMLSLRELNVAGLSQKNLVNTWFKYTHGYGLAAFMANEFDEQGYPKYVAKDMPYKAKYPILQTNEPRIYFGEFNEEEQPFVFLNTKIKEFDYPSDSKDVDYSYKSIPYGAIKMDTWKKLIVANKEDFFKIWLNDKITKESYFVKTRNILDRVKKALPFLQFDTDPLPVITKDGIVFIIDAFIVNDNIPYANGYIRNSIKVTVDTYTGKVTAYLSDKKDPIIQVWNKIFPGLFKNLDMMPETLKSHLRYPEDMMKIQRLVYQSYHVNDSAQFFEGNNKYSLGNDKGPYFNITKFPSIEGFDKMSMKLISTMTYEKRPNLSAILVGDWIDGELKLVAFHANTDSPFRGPKQFKKSVQADENMKPKLTLWNNNGAVIFGPIIPNIVGNVDNVITMFYSQPIYVNSEGEGAIPKITRIAVGNDKKVAWSNSAEGALVNLFDQVFRKTSTSKQEQTNVKKNYDKESFVKQYIQLQKNGDSLGLLKLLNTEEQKILNYLK